MSFFSRPAINPNIGARNAFHSLNNIISRMGNVQRRLALGKRINSSADDPAGNTLAKKLVARSGALSQVYNNVINMKNILSITEGGLATINNV